MPGKHVERGFEDAIEHHLVKAGGWLRGSAADYDRSRALFPSHVLAFLQETQPKAWAQLKAQPTDTEDRVLHWLGVALESRGTLDVLRHGFKVDGTLVQCAYFKPPSGLNAAVLALYAKNQLTVTRQVRFAAEGNDSVDLLFSLNGLPVATVELKTPFTHQNVEDAVEQYKARDPKELLFQFKKRSLVHFAVDPDLAYMTTRLAGKATRFLPFNPEH
jgi:type I restriction enzyme R subunit